MNNKFKKKGAVEMSLNLIIMLIIGMVVLGLVIGFVNQLVGKGVEGFDAQIGENEQLKIDKVKSLPGNLEVEPSPAASVKIGEKTNIFIKVRAYDSDINCGAGNLDSCELTYEVLDEEGNPAPNSLVLSGPGFKAAGGKQDSKMYTLKTLENAQVGTYYLTLNLYGGEETSTLTVTVK